MPFHIINYYCKRLVAMFDYKSTEKTRLLAIREAVVLGIVLPYYRTATSFVWQRFDGATLA